jgi:membrane-bound lytic murein transglycosylase F
MINSSQKLLASGTGHSLLSVVLVTASLFLAASSNHPALPESVALQDEHHFNQMESMKSGGKELFTQRIASRLPKYKGLIRGAASMNRIDWHLLAAMSYQESFWNPDATSPTGVRGFMMLTRLTANELDIENRLDARESIYGGAKYFSQLRDRLPERIREPDRTFMALAAYNMGMNHLEDARILAEHYGRNPDSWDDVEEFVPLLQRREYYSALPSGFARGEEAVNYVQHVREYHAVLAWNTQLEERRLVMAQNNNSMARVNAMIDPGINPFSL